MGWGYQSGVTEPESAVFVSWPEWKERREREGAGGAGGGGGGRVAFMLLA